MNDDNTTQASPADRYKDATVGEKPKTGGIGSRYAGYSVVEPGDAQREHTTEETERALGTNFGKPNEKHTAGDWIADVVRGTLFGPLADPISATYLSKTHDVSYKRALKAVRAGRHEKGVSTSASILGAVLGGGFIYKGGKFALQTLATKNGMVDGAMKWAVSDSRIKRVAASAAAGAGAAGVEEAVRTSLEEAVDYSGGEAFDQNRVINNTLTGALMGAAAAPVLEAGAGGAKWVLDFFKRQDASNPQAAMDATKRVLQAFKKEGETLDEAAMRYKQAAIGYELKHKRKATASSLLAPEEVANVSEVIRSYNGLDQYARQLGEEGVDRALKELDDAVTAGGVIPAPNTIRHRANEIMNDVMNRKGNTMVSVDEVTMSGLQNRQGMIDTLADQGNAGAQSIQRVLRARSSLDDLKGKMSQSLDKANDAGGRLEIANFREDLGRMIDELHEAHRKNPEDMDIMDKINDLKNTIQLRNAIEKRAAAGRASGRADQNYNELAKLTSLAQQEIDNYARNGLKIRLGDANNMRHAASDRSYKFRLSDPDKAAEARTMRDLIAPIGTTEVPEYGKVIKRYNLEMIRSEAQDMGVDAAKGVKDLDELATQIKTGQSSQRRARQGRSDQKYALLEGAAEGSRRQLQNELRDTPVSGAKAAQRLSTSKQTQQGIGQTLDKESADYIKETADQVLKEYDNYMVMAKPTSISELAEERRFMGEVITGSVFGSMGGAGRAALLQRILTKAAIPRGTAKKMVDMLGKPGEMEDAMRIMQKKGIRLGPLGAAILAGTGTPQENEQ